MVLKRTKPTRVIMAVLRTTDDILNEIMDHLLIGDVLIRGVAKKDLVYLGSVRYRPVPPQFDECFNCDTNCVPMKTDKLCTVCWSVTESFGEYPSVVFHTSVCVNGKFYVVSRCYVDDIGDQLS